MEPKDVDAIYLVKDTCYWYYKLLSVLHVFNGRALFPTGFDQTQDVIECVELQNEYKKSKYFQ